MNGNRKVIETVRDNIRNGKSIDIDTRDELLFTAVIDIYDQLEKFQEKFQPVMFFYKVGVTLASAISLALIGGLITGQIRIIFVP